MRSLERLITYQTIHSVLLFNFYRVINLVDKQTFTMFKSCQSQIAPSNSEIANRAAEILYSVQIIFQLYV